MPGATGSGETSCLFPSSLCFRDKVGLWLWGWARTELVSKAPLHSRLSWLLQCSGRVGPNFLDKKGGSGGQERPVSTRRDFPRPWSHWFNSIFRVRKPAFLQ